MSDKPEWNVISIVLEGILSTSIAFAFIGVIISIMSIY